MMNLYKILQTNRGIQVKQRNILIQQKKSRKRKRDLSPSSISNSWTYRRIKKPISVKVFHITPRSDRQKWILPTDMAEYANQQFEVYMPDVDIEESFLQHHSISSITHKVKVVYDFL